MNTLTNLWYTVRNWYQKHIGARITSAFLVFLGLAFVLWYASKLQYTYTTTVPITVSVDDNSHRIICVVEGQGHTLLSMRYFKRAKVKIKSTDVELVPVEGMENAYKVTNHSLQSAIALRNSELKIISVGDFPYIEYPQ